MYMKIVNSVFCLAGFNGSLNMMNKFISVFCFTVVDNMAPRGGWKNGSLNMMGSSAVGNNSRF